MTEHQRMWSYLKRWLQIAGSQHGIVSPDMATKISIVRMVSDMMDEIEQKHFVGQDSWEALRGSLWTMRYAATSFWTHRNFESTGGSPWRDTLESIEDCMDGIQDAMTPVEAVVIDPP